jgi:hypothetical protein
MFYGDGVKMCEDFALKLETEELAVASRQCNISHVSSQGIFDQKQRDCPVPPTFLFSVSPVEDKTERPPLRHI